LEDVVKSNLWLLQLAVVFIPGIIWARLDASYAAKTAPSDIEFFLRIFLFGITVYAVEFVVFTVSGLPFTMADLASASTKEVVTKAILSEIVWGLAISLVLSIGWLYLSTYKVITRVLQKIGATKKYGDEDVWDYTFNARDAAVEYVHVRDFQNGYVYAGWVNTFSETDKLRELVLLDVIVYNFDAERLYETPRLYLARAPENAHIEFHTGQNIRSPLYDQSYRNGRLQQGATDQ